MSFLQQKGKIQTRLSQDEKLEAAGKGSQVCVNGILQKRER